MHLLCLKSAGVRALMEVIFMPVVPASTLEVWAGSL